MGWHEVVAEVAPESRRLVLHTLASAVRLLDSGREAAATGLPPEAREAAVTADLSPGQAAQQTGLSRSLVYREIERGHLRAYKVGGRLRITREALVEWKRLHAVVPRAEAPAYEPRLSSRRPPATGSFAAELRAIRDGKAA